MEDIILLGYGGHAKSIADCIEETGYYRIIGYTDIERKTYRYEYLGTDAQLEELYYRGIHNAVICIGYLGKDRTRDTLYKKIKDIGFFLPSIVSSQAILAKGVRIGEGTYVGKAVVINSEAIIGKMCIINSAATIEHDCVVEDFAHVSVGSILCGGVRVGKHAFIGAGATIIQNRSVEEDSIVPAGAVVR